MTADLADADANRERRCNELTNGLNEQFARAEAAEKRVAELEARPDALTVAACSAEVCARLCALTERVVELEGALEAAADVIRDHLAESYPAVLDRAVAALSDAPPVADERDARIGRLEGALRVALEWLDGWLPDEANDCGGREMRRECRAVLASGNGEVSHD